MKEKKSTTVAIQSHWFSVVYLLTLMGFTVLPSCQAVKTTGVQIFNAERYCQVMPTSSSYNDSLWASISAIDSVFPLGIKQRFSQRARSIGADIGILPLLNQFVQTEKRLQHNLTDADQVKMNTIRQNISEHIMLASLDVSNVLAEIECEQDRALAMKNYLQLQADKRTRKLTIYSILAGAISTIFVSTLTLSNGKPEYIESVSVGGGLIGGYLAVRTLTTTDQALFNHPRNHLKDIRDNPKRSKVYPPMVWHFLTRELENQAQTPTAREIILDRWKELNLLTEAQSEAQRARLELLFGNGGIYGNDEISHRISLIDSLETEIALMQQELQQLQQELLQ
ncbi:MAG: hypothetical protein V4714_17085 [Bacteroidota bacterium]